MHPKHAISVDSIALNLEATDKWAAIEELLDILVRGGKIPDREAALDVLLTREKKMSTAMGNGIAIPHGKTSTVDTLVSAIGIKPEGLDFDAIDGEPCTLFVLTLSPTTRTGPHIQFLAEISRQLTQESVRQKILSATTEAEVHQILTSA